MTSPDGAESFNMPEAFASFLLLAIDHGFESIQHGRSPLVPFAMMMSQAGEKTLTRFVTTQLEEGLVRARTHVRETRMALEMYAIAWDGYVTIDSERTDAILVEAGRREDPKALIFCQRYLITKSELSHEMLAERIGNPALIDRVESQLV